MANTTRYIIPMPATFATSRGRTFQFPWAVQGQSGVPYKLRATQADGSPFDLTGATLTGTIKVVNAVYPMTGAFTVDNAVNGDFTWEPEEEDTAIWGQHIVQFTATKAADDVVLSAPMVWPIEQSSSATASPAPPLVGVPPSDAATLALLSSGILTAFFTLVDVPASPTTVNTNGVVSWSEVEDISSIVGTVATGWAIIQIDMAMTMTAATDRFLMLNTDTAPPPAPLQSSIYYAGTNIIIVGQHLMVPITNSRLHFYFEGASGSGTFDYRVLGYLATS